MRLFIGTYTTVEGHVPDGKGEGIVTLDYDAGTGAVSKVGALDVGKNPTYLARSGCGKYLYVVGEADEDAKITSLKLDKDANPSVLNSVPSNMQGACHVIVLGDHIVVAAYVSGQVGTWAIKEDGSLATEPTSFITHKSIPIPVAGTNPDRQDAPHAHQVCAHPSGNYVYVPDLGADSVVIYKHKQGTLEYSSKFEPPPGSGPRHMVFNNSGTQAFILNELFCTISVCTVAEDGGLTLSATVDTLPEGSKVGVGGQSFSAALRLSPDGKFLYASNRGFDTLAIFSVNDDGSLKFLAYQPTGADVSDLPEVKWPPIHTPRDFILNGDAGAIVANQDSHQIVTFSRDPKTGLLSQQAKLEVFSPVCVVAV